MTFVRCEAVLTAPKQEQQVLNLPIKREFLDFCPLTPKCAAYLVKPISVSGFATPTGCPLLKQIELPHRNRFSIFTEKLPSNNVDRL